MLWKEEEFKEVNKVVLILISLSVSLTVTACSTSNGMRVNAKQEQNKAGSAGSTKKEPDKTGDSIQSIVQRMTDDKVTAFYQWEIDTKTTLYCIVRDTGKSEFPGEPTATLSIIDKQGRVSYQVDNVKIQSLSTSAPLRKDTSQLVVEINTGGKDTTLKILDYQEGKITELLDEEDQDYS